MAVARPRACVCIPGILKTLESSVPVLLLLLSTYCNKEWKIDTASTSFKVVMLIELSLPLPLWLRVRVCALCVCVCPCVTCHHIGYLKMPQRFLRKANWNSTACKSSVNVSSAEKWLSNKINRCQSLVATISAIIYTLVGWMHGPNTHTLTHTNTLVLLSLWRLS